MDRVNVSAVQFRAGSSLEADIAATLKRLDIEPGGVEVELTESVLMEVTQQNSQALEALRQLGVRISIDDFGTGYSSLSYLTSYSVNRLKIAQQLVFGITTDIRNATVVRATVRLAQELGIECIAEGVEIEEQANFLISAGCATAQGDFFSKPISAEQMTHLLKQQGVLHARTHPKSAVVAA